MKRLTPKNSLHLLSSQQKSVAQVWDEIHRFSTPALTGIHSYLDDGRPLMTVFATSLESGSFKERGALAKMNLLYEKGCRQAVTFSAGNHAAGCALAARKLGMFVHVFVPCYTPEVKIKNTQELGGDLVRIEKCSGDFEQTREVAFRYAKKHKLVIVEPFDDLDIARGQGTILHEFLLRNPKVDHLFVPQGGGGLVAGCILAVKQLGLNTKVYGVKLSSECELCEGAHVKKPGKVALQVIKQNPELWGSTLYVDPADVGAMVAYEDTSHGVHRKFPEATALLGPSAAHKYFSQFDGTIATIITGSNADHAKLDILHDWYLHKLGLERAASRSFQVAGAYQLRQYSA